MNRRAMIRCLAIVAAGLAASSCGDGFTVTGKKLVVIGIDGMDPNLLRQYMAEGAMPNFKALADEGTFVPLGTSNPPQSPVAWSCFITGMDPGGHGVFDFLHRDPATYLPMSSTQVTLPPHWYNHPVALPGCYQIEIPPASEPVRKGVPWWDLLADRGVRAEVYRIPAAYPIQESRQRALSDMGTPDLQGGIDGMYVYYTSDAEERFSALQEQWQQVRIRDGRTTDAKLLGPPSPYRRPCLNDQGVLKPVEMAKTPFTVFIDPTEQVVHIEIEDGDSCVLEQGKWSEWLRCSFDLGLLQSMNGMVKFYLQQAHPSLRLYCSAVNIDPREPCMPISSPDDDAVEEVCEAIGPFYTAGLAEETKALQQGIITDGEFISQCDDVTAERLRMLDHALDRFDDGLLFFYFSSIDLRCHMMWRHIEPGHPARDEKLAAEFAGSIEDAYKQMDAALGLVRSRIGRETPIIVLSDHGFAPFLRNVDVNQWMWEQGYLEPDVAALAEERKKLAAELANDPKAARKIKLAKGMDRARTKAYAIGFNGIYLNLKGREAGGVVEPGERDALLGEIRTKLLALRDPQRGNAPVVLRVDRREEVYHGDQLDHAPDLVVGYARGYGASDETALGELQIGGEAGVLTDNRSRWSGNHLMAPEVVPGVFLTNRKLSPKEPNLVDVTATMLEFFGVPPTPQMRGRSLF